MSIRRLLALHWHHRNRAPALVLSTESKPGFVLIGMILFAFATLVTVPIPARAATSPTLPTPVVAPNATTPLPLLFVPNVGQWQPELRYLTRAADFDALFLLSHVELRLRDDKAPARLRLRPICTNAAAELRPGTPRTTVLHAFRGQDPARWHRNIPTYEDLRYVAVYQDIDLLFRTQERQLAYDFILHPGADPGQIRIAVEGAYELTLEPDGSLRANLADDRSVSQPPPVVYQELDGERELVSGQFRLLTQAATDETAPVYGFEIGAYDTTRRLIIDPTLVYSNFVGGGSDERISALHVTSSGKAIVAGTTASSDFAEALGPSAIGPEDDNGTVSLGRDNGFIYQVNEDGTSLDFVTLLGGGSSDELHDLAVDSNGNIYVAGSTSSDDFPLVNPLFGVLTGRSDAFVTKLDNSGRLITDETGFSTYYGGNGETSANTVALDDDGNIYIAGVTAAPDLVLRNPLFPRLAGGRGNDGFIAQFAPNGAMLEFATYFGGSSSDSIDMLIVSNSLATTARPLASDTGDLFFVGHTTSSATDRDGNQNFPLKHALQAELGGRQDGFLARIARGGQELVFSTYWGGSSDDVIADFAMDAVGNYLMVGYTSSEDWPTHNAMIPEYPIGSRNDMGTITKIDKSGRFPHFSTYLGAAGDDLALAVAAGLNADAEDVIYVAGTTDSNAFPALNSYQGFHAGASDGFLAILDGSGQTMKFSSYYGGTATDEIVAIKPGDPRRDDVVIFAGNTLEERSASLFPVGSSTPFQAEHAGRLDSFVGRLDLDPAIDLGPRLPVLSLGSDDDPAADPIYQPGLVLPPSVGDGVGFVLRIEDRPAPAAGVIAFSTRLFYDPAVLKDPQLTWRGSSFLDAADKVPAGPGGPLTCVDGECEIRVFQPSGPSPVGRLDAGLTDNQLATISFAFVDGENTIASQEVVVHLQDVSSAAIEGDLDDVISGLPSTRLVERHCNDILGDCDCSGRVQLFEVQSALTYSLNPPSAGDPDTRPICVKSNYQDMSGTDLSDITNNYTSGVTEVADNGGNGGGDGELLGVSQTMEMGILSNSTQHGASLHVSAGFDRLDFGSPKIDGDQVSLDLELNVSEEPSVLFVDIYYDPSNFEQISGITGPATSSVGKQVLFNIVEFGWLRMVVHGINRTTIPNGIVAMLKLDLAPSKAIEDVSLDMKASAAIPSLESDIDLSSNALANGIPGCSDSSRQHVTEAYLGYYSRCPDPAGMAYWCERLDNEGKGSDLSSIIAAFGTSQEYTKQYANLSSSDLINNLYANILGRDAEPSGQEFYIDLLGQYEKEWRDQQNSPQGATEQALSRIALDILNGAQGTDLVWLQNRVGMCEE